MRRYHRVIVEIEVELANPDKLRESDLREAIDFETGELVLVDAPIEHRVVWAVRDALSEGHRERFRKRGLNWSESDYQMREVDENGIHPAFTLHERPATPNSAKGPYER